jgi:autotransporter-associated beta strand protein
MRRELRLKLRGIASAVVIAITARSSLAGSSVWTGNGDGVNWNNANNWDSSGAPGVPTGANDLFFEGPANTTINLNANRGCASISFDTANDALGAAGTSNTLTPSSTVVTMGDYNGTINAVLAGENGLYVDGMGQLTLTNSNTYNSGTQITATDGISDFQTVGINISSDANLGFSGSAVGMDNGNVFATSSLTTTRDFALTNGGFGAASGALFTISGTVQDVTGAVSTEGGGTVFFNDPDTPTWTTLDIGTVNTGSGYLSTGTSNVQFSSIYALGGGAERIHIGDNAGLELTTGTATLSGAINTVDSSTGSHANFTADSGTVLTLSGPITDLAGSQAGGIEINGSGRVVLSATNSTYGGNTLIDGTLSISANTNLPANSPIVFGYSLFVTLYTPGTLMTTQSMIMSRSITLGVHGGSFAPATGTQLILNGALTANGGLTLQGPGQLILDGVNVYTALPSLTILGGDFVFAPSEETSLITSSLVFGGVTNAWTGQLDLLNGDMIVHGGSLATISNQIAEGYNGARWNGSGITSSIAAGNSKHNTGLGVILNDNGAGKPLYGTGGIIASTFGADIPVDGDILVQYSYYGDTNLDGKVDGSDYSRIDSGFLKKLTGWYNGDFNYDGVINGSDYTLIDNSYNTQGAATFAEVAGAVITAEVAQTSAVPEPVWTVGLLGATFLRMRHLPRRPRRAELTDRL